MVFQYKVISNPKQTQTVIFIYAHEYMCMCEWVYINKEKGQ